MTLLPILAAHGALATHWDEPGVIAVNLAAIVLLVLLNGFFVAAEFALVKVRGSQLDPLIEDGNTRAQLARYIITHLDAYLSATQFGVTMASLALGAIGEPYFSRLLQPVFLMVGVSSPELVSGISIGLGFAVITFLHIIIGELAPKYLSIRLKTHIKNYFKIFKIN